MSDYLWRNHDEVPSDALSRYVAMSLGERMDFIRNLCKVGLRNRKVKLRQPLASVTIVTRNPVLVFDREYREMIRSELNVKSVIVLEGDGEAVGFDETITPELEREGLERQAIREASFARQKAEKSR